MEVNSLRSWKLKWELKKLKKLKKLKDDTFGCGVHSVLNLAINTIVL